MTTYKKAAIYLLGLALMAIACKSKIKQQEDEIYSRHLQEHLKLSIISTPLPDDKNALNLLILNDGQDMAQLRIKETIDSLNKKGLIRPLLIVGVHAGDRNQDYGVAGLPDYKNNGSKAEKYSSFIHNELYDFIKKKAGVRKFSSIVIAGCSLGGLSAMDVAWNNADRIDKVGVFSGSFWWRDKDAAAKDYSDSLNRILLSKIRSSRKRPKLQYFFYAGDQEEAGDRDKDGIIDVVDDTRDLVAVLKKKSFIQSADISTLEKAGGTHDYNAWSNVFPSFLVWAFGK